MIRATRALGPLEAEYRAQGWWEGRLLTDWEVDPSHTAIVDADRSATSLIYVQSIASAPGVTVAERSSDMRSAMQAVRSGDAIAAVYIPENFERDLLARKRPQVVSLYNRQYFTPGNNAASAIQSAVSAATAALPRL